MCSCRCLIFVLIFTLSGQAHAKSEFRQKIEQIIQKSGISKKELSIKITERVSGNDKEIYQLHPDKKRIPASLTKILTAGATLWKFSPGYQFVTELATNASKEGSILKGNLYLKGGGDPSFVAENLWFLVNAFTREGIKLIEGDLIVDDSLFDSERFDPSRQDRRVDRAYDAPIGAMSFNWNTVNVFVRPSLKRGDFAKVWIDPSNKYIELRNRATTGKRGSKLSLNVQRSQQEGQEKDIITVSGKIPMGHSEKVFYKSIRHPSLWSGYNLKSFLRQRGIVLSGKVRRGSVPQKLRVLAESKSKPIQNIVADMMKFSNNYVAEMLTKNLAVDEPPATMPEGMKVIRKFLNTLGLKGKYQIINPSGLTRRNHLTVGVVWKTLNFLRSQFQFFPEFVTTLPIAGVDGTLKARMRGTSAQRWVRAKTGLLNGVVGLAGFAGRPDGTVLTFVFLYNGTSGDTRAQRLFDKLAVQLVEGV